MRDFQQRFSGPLQLLGEADISGSVLEQLGQQFAASEQRLIAHVGCHGRDIYRAFRQPIFLKVKATISRSWAGNNK